jgi:hypothetical protein
MTARERNSTGREARPEPAEPLPESAMGGASDMGAHGRHPVSSPALKREHRSVDPDAAPGDAPVERRRGPNPDYRGEERRMARR